MPWKSNREQIEADAVLIATGSMPRPLKFEGADLVKTSNDILALRDVALGRGVFEGNAERNAQRLEGKARDFHD